MWRWIPLLAAVGCAQPERQLTWYGDIGPVMVERCGGCHRDGGIAPFSMERYDDVAPWTAAMVAAVEDGTMPPWAARDTDECSPPLDFQHDPRLTEDEIDALRAWVQAGAPAGRERPIPLPDTGEIEAPDAVVALQEPFAVSGDRDIYQCFRVEVPHDRDVWITGMQVIPDNSLVVHHVLVWNDPDNLSLGRVGPDGSYPCSGQPDFWPTDLVGGWTPGSPPVHNPDGTGTLFKAGASLVVNVHYHPTGETTELDRTQIALEWTEEQPDNYVTYFLIDEPFGAVPVKADGSRDTFEIPAGRKHHTETLRFAASELIGGAVGGGARVPLPWPLRIFAVMPHMHYRGTEMKVWIEHEHQLTGSALDDTCLVHAVDYRFDFQNNYLYAMQSLGQLPTLEDYDVVYVRCTYDNSWGNPFMEEALAASGDDDLVDVYWGEETGDEMCMAVVGFVTPQIDLSTLF